MEMKPCNHDLGDLKRFPLVGVTVIPISGKKHNTKWLKKKKHKSEKMYLELSSREATGQLQNILSKQLLLLLVAVGCGGIATRLQRC